MLHINTYKCEYVVVKTKHVCLFRIIFEISPSWGRTRPTASFPGSIVRHGAVDAHWACLGKLHQGVRCMGVRETKMFYLRLNRTLLMTKRTASLIATYNKVR